MLLALALLVVSSGLAPAAVEGAAPGLSSTTLGVGGVIVGGSSVKRVLLTLGKITSIGVRKLGIGRLKM